MKQILTEASQKGFHRPEDLNVWEQRLVGEYCAIVDEFQGAMYEAAEIKWNALSSDVYKANYDPERFLRQLVSDNSLKVLSGLNHRERFHQMVEHFGLCSHYTHGVGGGDKDLILVVGKDRNQVLEEVSR